MEPSRRNQRQSTQRENCRNKPNSLPWGAPGCRERQMVRRGSTVRSFLGPRPVWLRDGRTERPMTSADRNRQTRVVPPFADVGYPDRSPSLLLLQGAAADDRDERDVFELNGLLEQPVEEQAAVVGAAAGGLGRVLGRSACRDVRLVGHRLGDAASTLRLANLATLPCAFTVRSWRSCTCAERGREDDLFRCPWRATPRRAARPNGAGGTAHACPSRP